MFSQYLDWWGLAAWCGINLVVPVAAPLVVLWLFSRPGTTAALAGRNVLKSIGKGELFWAAMGMSAATCHELYTLQKILADPNEIGLPWLGFWLHLGVIMFAVIFVGVGSLSAASAHAANPHIPDPTVFRASIGTLAFTITTYTLIYSLLMVHETQIKSNAIQAAIEDKRVTLDKVKACLARKRASALLCMEDVK